MRAENKTPEQKQEADKKIDIFKYLEHLGGMTPEHIAKFRTELRPEERKEFDSLNEHDKMVITALDYLSDKELEDLIKLGLEQGRLVGFHDVFNYIQKIYSLTKEERYRKI